MFKIGRVKKVATHIRTWTKLTILIILAIFLIVALVAFVYKPIYSVSFNGEQIGYCENKSALQEKINQYIEAGDGENIAFVEINQLPQYTLCLLKKGITPNDEEIYQKVISSGTPYYNYFAIAVNNEEKAYVSTYAEAESVVNQLKEKDSANKDKLTIVEKYETSKKDFTAVETCVANLYEKKKEVVVTKSSYVPAASVNTSSKKVNLGISLIKPVSGILTSRFGSRWGSSHKGIDIGANKGTSIKAAASGTVTISSYGYNGGYGNYVMISHGNGVQTLYGHCSKLYVSVGQKVSQGETIAAVGSTGRSTGNHLHLEIRVNGVAQNPLNYVSY